MTQSITPQTTLYDRDLNLWLENAIAQLKSGDLQKLDVDNLIEELESLAGKDKRELETRLKRLIEHILKRCYINMPECYRGWEITIINQRTELIKLLEQSPSLKRHFSQIFDRAFDTALNIVQLEYPQTNFPDTWQFNQNIDTILKIKFWELN